MYSDQRRSLDQRWALLGVVFLLAILAILGMPRISQVQPIPESEVVPSTASIHVVFNRPMDRVSVESRFKLEPSQSGQFRWDEDGKELSFIPDDPWPQGEEIVFSLSAGSRTNFFLPILRSYRWSFTVGAPRIAYLWPAGEPAELYARSIVDRETIQMTETTYGVIDFAVRYEAAKLVYTVATAGGGSEIWHLDLVSDEHSLVFTCPDGFRCDDPHLSPDLTEVAFVQSSLEEDSTGKLSVGSSEIWKVRIGGEGQAFRISRANHDSTSPRWSPKGLLAYYDATAQEILVVEPVVLPNPAVRGSVTSELGAVGDWAADGISLIFPDIVFLDETYTTHEATGDEFPLFYSHIFRQSIDFGLREDLSRVEFELVEDTSPVLSPDGKRIAFSRKYLEEDLWTPGRQVWVMRVDGSEANQLTNFPDHNHSSLAWDPDGALLSFVRINQIDFGTGPEVWILDVEADNLLLVSNGGFLPQWIP